MIPQEKIDAIEHARMVQKLHFQMDELIRQADSVRYVLALPDVQQYEIDSLNMALKLYDSRMVLLLKMLHSIN